MFNSKGVSRLVPLGSLILELAMEGEFRGKMKARKRGHLSVDEKCAPTKTSKGAKSKFCGKGGFLKIDSVVNKEGILPNITQMWDLKINHKPCPNLSTSRTSKTKLKPGLAESEDQEGPMTHSKAKNSSHVIIGS